MTPTQVLCEMGIEVVPASRFRNKGVNCHAAKLTSDQARDIKAAGVKRGKPRKGLARRLMKEYNVSNTTILNIWNDKTWIHI